MQALQYIPLTLLIPPNCLTDTRLAAVRALLLLLLLPCLQMLVDQFMSIRQMQLGHLWNKQTAWQGFKDLLDQGLVAFTASR